MNPIPHFWFKRGAQALVLSPRPPARRRQGTGYEVQTARNPRMEQAADVVERIAALAYPTEPVVVCGDFNDAYHGPATPPPPPFPHP